MARSSDSPPGLGGEGDAAISKEIGRGREWAILGIRRGRRRSLGVGDEELVHAGERGGPLPRKPPHYVEVPVGAESTSFPTTTGKMLEPPDRSLLEGWSALKIRAVWRPSRARISAPADDVLYFFRGD